jgi:hypothetical protein
MSDKIPSDDYVPYGEEWQKEMSQLPKGMIIKMFSKKATEQASTISEQELEIERLKGLIEKAHYKGYNDGSDTRKIKYTSTESFMLFKSLNNL